MKKKRILGDTEAHMSAVITNRVVDYLRLKKMQYSAYFESYSRITEVPYTIGIDDHENINTTQNASFHPAELTTGILRNFDHLKMELVDRLLNSLIKAEDKLLQINVLRERSEEQIADLNQLEVQSLATRKFLVQGSLKLMRPSTLGLILGIALSIFFMASEVSAYVSILLDFYGLDVTVPVSELIAENSFLYFMSFGLALSIYLTLCLMMHGFMILSEKMSQLRQWSALRMPLLAAFILAGLYLTITYILAGIRIQLSNLQTSPQDSYNLVEHSGSGSVTLFYWMVVSLAPLLFAVFVRKLVVVYGDISRQRQTLNESKVARMQHRAILDSLQSRLNEIMEESRKLTTEYTSLTLEITKVQEEMEAEYRRELNNLRHSVDQVLIHLILEKTEIDKLRVRLKYPTWKQRFGSFILRQFNIDTRYAEFSN